MGNGVNLFQFIVPLAFLAIWALTFLINREAQPLPPRAGRPVGPPGPPRPRPMAGGPTLGRPVERGGEPFARDAAARWPTTAGAPGRPGPVRPGMGRPGVGGDDEILIIESESKRPAPPPQALRRPEAGAPRRGRGRAASSAGATKRQESATPRALSAALGQETAAASSPLELTPLTKSVLPLSTQTSHDAAGRSAAALNTDPLPSLSGQRVLQLMKSPAKLREAIILNELLQPPLALRSPRSRRV